MRLNRVNIPMAMELDNAVVKLNTIIVNISDINEVNRVIENTLQRMLHTQEQEKNSLDDSKKHSDSSHCHAIAQANYNMVKYLLNQDVYETLYQ